MTPEQFLTHLRELKVAAVRAKLYTEALILDQADLDIQTYHEKTALCQPCTPPDNNWYGLRAFVLCIRPDDIG